MATKKTKEVVTESTAAETDAVQTTEQSVSETSLEDKIKDIIGSIDLSGTIDKDALVEQIKDKLGEVSAEFKDQLDSIVKDLVNELANNAVDSFSEKIDNVLERKKEQWAALAVQDPDEARRKLRVFWAGVSGVCFVIGLAIGIFVF